MRSRAPEQGASRSLEVFGNLLARDLAVAQDLGEKTWADVFACVNWHHSRPAIWVAKVVVTASYPVDLKAYALEGANQAPGSDRRQPTHAGTLMR
jgi:hypothetical protein